MRGWSTHMKKFLVISLLLLVPGLIFAQSQGKGGLNPAELLKPLGTGAQWPTYCGDYTCKRYSALKLINKSNVQNLSLAWVSSFTMGSGPDGTSGGAGGFRGFRGRGGGGYPTIVGGLGTGELNTGGPARFDGGSVLAVNNVLYLTAPDNIWAVDALNGSIIWHYYWKTRGGTHTGNRGLGMYGNWLYMETADDMLVSVDATTGKQRWAVPISSFSGQYFSSMAPVVIGNHLMVGTGNDENAPGFLQSFDPVTGKLQWRHYNVPMKEGDPGYKSWPNIYAARHGGADVWIPGSYDPETHLYIYGTSNPTPAYTIGPKTPRGSDKYSNLFTCSMIAVNVDTGKMAWYYQTSPHDMHDWDASEAPVLIDEPINGRMRKLVLQADRNGYFFVLDRVTGKHLVTSKFGTVNNWAQGLNKEGQPVLAPDKHATIPGSLVNGDVTNFWAPTYSPLTNLFYVRENNSLAIMYLIDPDPRGSMGLGGSSEGGRFSFGSYIDAINYKTGKVVWRHDTQGSSGMLTTAGGLLFAGDGNYLVAYDATTGHPLWHTRIGSVSNGPETFMMDGHQYLIVEAGSQLFAFVLNQPSAK